MVNRSSLSAERALQSSRGATSSSNQPLCKCPQGNWRATGIQETQNLRRARHVSSPLRESWRTERRSTRESVGATRIGMPDVFGVELLTSRDEQSVSLRGA